MPTPSFNIQNGQVSGQWPSDGGTFYWYNPTSAAVSLTNCGTFCMKDSYDVPPVTDPSGGYLQAYLRNPTNPNAYAFTDPAWNTPGMPHLQTPTMPRPDAVDDDSVTEEIKREVA